MLSRSASLQLSLGLSSRPPGRLASTRDVHRSSRSHGRAQRSSRTSRRSQREVSCAGGRLWASCHKRYSVVYKHGRLPHGSPVGRRRRVHGRGKLRGSSNAGALQLATDAARQRHVLGHDSDALGVESTEVAVFEERDHVRLTGLLEGEQGVALEPEALVHLVRNLADKPLEGALANQEIRALLVLLDLHDRLRTRTEAALLVRLVILRRSTAPALGAAVGDTQQVTITLGTLGTRSGSTAGTAGHLPGLALHKARLPLHSLILDT